MVLDIYHLSKIPSSQLLRKVDGKKREDELEELMKGNSSWQHLHHWKFFWKEKGEGFPQHLGQLNLVT